MNLTAMLDYSLVARAVEQELKLLVRLKAPACSTRKRKPLHLVVVIDRSGSMAGPKIENTRHALKTLVTHLDADDYLGLVQFDDEVQVLLEPGPVKDKDAVKQAIQRLHTGGSTNLSGGWLRGLELLRQHASPDRINRCLLLTDGQANVGIQDTRQLAHLGKSARQEFNAVTTTLGFGEGFNEDLLTAIARESGGGFYFVDKAEQAPAIFNEELQGLLRLAAQNIEVTLRLERAVTMTAQWTDYPMVPGPNGLAFTLGDAYSGEEKNLLLSLLVPGLGALGPAAIAQLDIRYAGIDDSGVHGMALTHEVRVNVAEADAAKDCRPEVEVQQQYGLQFAAKARKQAIAEADGGDYCKAESTLKAAMSALTALPDPGDLLKDEIQDLAQQAESMDANRYSHTRKLMREDAFNTSTGSYNKTLAARLRRQTGTPPPDTTSGSGTKPPTSSGKARRKKS